MGLIERMEANNVRHRADRAEHRASRLAEKKPEKAASLRETASRLHHYAEDLRAQDETQKEAKASTAATKAATAEGAAKATAAAKADLAAFRASHPLEAQLNKAAMLHLWPRAKHGSFPAGPVCGAHAELFNANAHKAWTASRLVSNATLGVSSGGMFVRGRKNKGAAQINIQLANGTVLSHGVKPQDLRAASRYVMAVNAYSEQLAAEKE